MLGRVVGHYRFDELLGKGAMGVVYRAHDMRLRRDVAIKVLEPGSLRDADAQNRFLKEARLQAQLEHPSIVRVYELTQKMRRLFLVMQHVRGETITNATASGSVATPASSGE